MVRLDAKAAAAVVRPSRIPTAAQARASLTQRSLSFLMVNATPREPPVPLEPVRSAAGGSVADAGALGLACPLSS